MSTKLFKYNNFFYGYNNKIYSGTGRKYLFHDGVDDRVLIPYKTGTFFQAAKDRTAFGFSCFVNFSSLSGTQSIYQLGGTVNGVGIGIVSGVLTFSLRRSSVKSCTASFSFTKGRWYHIACSHDSTNGMRIFVNNLLVGSNSGAFTWRVGDAGHSLGGILNNQSSVTGVTSATEILNGFIDRTSVFAVGLTTTDISNLVARSVLGSEQALWPINEGQGIFLFDSTTTVNGTMYGGTWL